MKTIFSLAILISLVAVGWYYIPPPTKNKMVAFVGGALDRESKKFPALIRDQVLPEDPEKKREALLGELKQKLAEMKTVVSDIDLILQSEKILEALEEANQEKPGITDKILERIFSSPQKQVCVEP